MNEIMIATKNPGKVKEFEHIFSQFNVTVKSLLDFPDAVDVVEDGKTFEENALKKARTISNQYQLMVLADDSGLEIDALNGRPGVYSARYAGDERDDLANINKVLAELRDVEQDKRSARFVCALAIVTPTGDEFVVRGECEGEIISECRGTEGFGYDPIFYLPQLEKTMAQIPKSQKNVLSHRANAFIKLEKIVSNLMR